MPEDVHSVPDCLGPEEWCVALSSAVRWLGAHVAHIDSLNVFPVPDGDTGTNMYLTLKAAAEACTSGPGWQSLGELAERTARAALLAARGNSGVILSQALIAMAQAFDGSSCADGPLFAEALSKAVDSSYSILANPVEGTILTVLRRTAEAAQALGRRGATLGDVLRASLEAARDAVADTPTLLEVLSQAGVVDAGGEGFRVILEGMLMGLEGRPLPQPRVGEQTLTRTAEVESANVQGGYCVTVTLKGAGGLLTDLRSGLQRQGTSVAVVAESEFIKVHVHSEDPTALLEWLSSQGEVHQVKVDRIFHRVQLPLFPPNQTEGRAALVVVAEGEGFIELFSRLGARVVSTRALTPTVEELLRAIEGSPGDKVLVLPNDPNVMLVAQQAANLASKTVQVVPTRTPQEGVAAAIAFSSDVDLQENVINMSQAARRVVSVEVTKAVRDAKVSGTPVRAGQFMAIIAGNGVATGDTLRTAVQGALNKLKGSGYGYVSVYYGADLGPDSLEEVMAEIANALPGAQVEVNWGGQKRALLLMSLED